MKKILLSLVFLAPIMVSAQSVNWDPAVVVWENGDNMRPMISLSSQDEPMIMWGNANGEVFFSRMLSGTFTTPIRVSGGGTAFTASWAGPQMASTGDTVYIVYKLTPEEEQFIYVATSYDGGLSFTPGVRVDFLGTDLSRMPAIGVTGNGNPAVGFMRFGPGFTDPEWHIAVSEDYGKSFLPDVKAGGQSGGEACDCCPGAIIPSGDQLILLYRDNLNNTRDIWAGISDDNGATFTRGADIDNTGWKIFGCPSTGPDGFVNGDTLYTTFMSGAAGSSRVYLSRTSVTSLEGYTELLFPSITGTSQNYPQIATDGNAAVLVWKQEKSSRSEIPVLVTSDIRDGFGTTYDLAYSGVSGSVQNVDVRLKGNTVHLVWESTNGKVNYRKGTISGTGIAGSSRSGLLCYPNPAADEVFISHSSQAGLQLSLISPTGGIVMEISEKSGNGFLLNTLTLPDGIYFLRGTAGMQPVHLKLSVIH